MIATLLALTLISNDAPANADTPCAAPLGRCEHALLSAGHNLEHDLLATRIQLDACTARLAVRTSTPADFLPNQEPREVEAGAGWLALLSAGALGALAGLVAGLSLAR